MVAVDVKKMDLPTLIALRATVDAEIADKQQAARAKFGNVRADFKVLLDERCVCWNGRWGLKQIL